MEGRSHLRRLTTRVVVLFAVVQILAIAGVFFTLPAIVETSGGQLLVLLVAVLDLALIVVAAQSVARAVDATPVERLSRDVLRIADGDYHHRVAQAPRLELRGISDSVNRLADRLIADQRLLAENVQSLEATNRQLVVARDQVIRSARLASVGTLAAGIAHEVGNPLGAVIGFVDVARARVVKAGGDPELLDSIRAEAGRIDRIVRGLLDYARPTSGGSGPGDAAEVLSSVVELMVSQGKLDGIEHIWSMELDQPATVQEPDRLQQVLVNLLLNAVHALEGVENPTIRVALRREEGAMMRLPARREEDPPGINYMHRRRAGVEDANAVATAEEILVFHVADNGPGIAEEIVDQLFDPFFTTKAPGEGTGLGLAICAQLVEGMGGRIETGEGLDGGAGFVVQLPLHELSETESLDSVTDSLAPARDASP